MATFYALPSLNSLPGVAGNWASTSGGPGNAGVPSAGSVLIFDASSGPARTITITTGDVYGGINTTGAAPMTFQSGGTYNLSSQGDINLTGTAAVDTLFMGNGTNGLASTLTAPGVPIANLTHGSLNTGNLTLASDLLVTGRLQIGCNGYKFDAAGFNVTAGVVLVSQGSSTSGPTVWLGSGTWTVTGVDGQYGTTYAFTVTNGDGTHVGPTINAGTATIKFTSKSSSAKTFRADGGWSWPTIWNDTEASGGLKLGFSSAGPIRCNTYRASPRTLTLFPAGGLTRAVNWVLDGQGGNVVLRSATAGTQASLGPDTGGATVVGINSCDVKDIAGSGMTFRAINSVDNGNNTGFVFLKNNSRFLSFL